MKRLLVIGDSWAASYVDGRGDTDILCDRLGVPPELRQAVSGSTAAQWLADFSNRLTTALATPCDAVLLSVGGNDAVAAFNNDQAITQDEVDFYFNTLRDLTAKLLAAHQRVYVLLYANPLPCDVKTGLGVMLLNAATLRSCAPGTLFIYSGDVLTAADMPGIGIHPSADGYTKLADHIAKCVESP